MGRFGLAGSGEPLVVVAPGAARWAAKKWPIGNFVELCRKLVADVQLCILGGEEECPLGRELASTIPEVKDLCGRSSIDDAINLVALPVAWLPMTRDFCMWPLQSALR